VPSPGADAAAPGFGLFFQRMACGSIFCLLNAWMWAREHKDIDGVRRGEKESVPWIEGYEQVQVAEQTAELPGTRLVYVAGLVCNGMHLLTFYKVKSQ